MPQVRQAVRRRAVTREAVALEVEEEALEVPVETALAETEAEAAESQQVHQLIMGMTLTVETIPIRMMEIMVFLR